MKKGEMSMNMIIGATIAIVILVIVVSLIIKHLINTDDAVDCPSTGGICTTADKCVEQIVVEDKYPTCKISGEICCKPI